MVSVPLADRVAQAVEAGFGKARLAEAAGVTSGAVSQWGVQVHSLKAKSARGLEKLTGWNARWWEDGTGPRDAAQQASNVVQLPAAPDCIRLLAEKLAALDDDARAISISALMGWLQRGAPVTSTEQLRRLLGEFSTPQAEPKLSRNGAT